MMKKGSIFERTANYVVRQKAGKATEDHAN
jgi:hypothetical protein